MQDGSGVGTLLADPAFCGEPLEELGSSAEHGVKRGKRQRFAEAAGASQKEASCLRSQFQQLGRLVDVEHVVLSELGKALNADGQYFSVEQYYLQPERIHILRRRFAEILLRLNCYDDMAVSFDSCESWEKNPDPETFADRLVCLSGNDFLRAVFEAQKTMVDIEHDDTYMTVYNPPPEFLNRLRMLASAEGLFVWNPQEFENNS